MSTVLGVICLARGAAQEMTFWLRPTETFNKMVCADVFPQVEKLVNHVEELITCIHLSSKHLLAFSTHISSSTLNKHIKSLVNFSPFLSNVNGLKSCFSLQLALILYTSNTLYSFARYIIYLRLLLCLQTVLITCRNGRNNHLKAYNYLTFSFLICITFLAQSSGKNTLKLCSSIQVRK
jgi:hypothetical protein